jgi:hypothetical protein
MNSKEIKVDELGVSMSDTHPLFRANKVLNPTRFGLQYLDLIVREIVVVYMISVWYVAAAVKIEGSSWPMK